MSVFVDSSVLQRPSYVIKETMKIIPGCKEMVLHKKGKYLYNFHLESNVLINDHRQFELAFDHIKNVKLKLDNMTLSTININHCVVNSNYVKYKYLLNFTPGAPLLMDALYNTKITFELDYKENSDPKQVCYLTYDVGYYNNTRATQILRNSPVQHQICYSDGTYLHNGILKSLCGNVIK